MLNDFSTSTGYPVGTSCITGYNVLFGCPVGTTYTAGFHG